MAQCLLTLLGKEEFENDDEEVRAWTGAHFVADAILALTAEHRE